MERAVLFGDATAGGDSPRLQAVSLLMGAALATLAIAGCAVFGWLRPQPGLADAAILLDRGSGALYVRVDDTIHPVMNLTSARLITQSRDEPRQVTAADLAHAKVGPQLGIPGAPASIGAALAADDSVWTVCEDDITTTVIIGQLGDDPPPTDQAMLVSSHSGRAYLIYDGRRAALNLADPVTVRALQLDGRTPRTVSDALLGIIPEAPPITPPNIPDYGNPAPQDLPGFVIGDVVQVERAGAADYFVILAGGLQRIGRVTADLIRFSAARTDADITSIAPAAASQIPAVGVLPVADYPDQISVPVGDEVHSVCASWGNGDTALRIGTVLPLQEGQTPVPLAQADGTGPAVDAICLPRGHNIYAGSAGAGYLVAETGVRYAVTDPDAVEVLELPDRPEPAPWRVLSLLPEGPELRRDAALLARDVLATETPPAGG
jgi:type VII secretion protein EccB